MSQTVKIGGVDYPLSSAPVASGSKTVFKITASNTVTPQAVFAAASGADSYIITVDGTADGEVDDVEFLGDSVGYDGSNITLSMRKKSTQEILSENLQSQIDALTLTALGVA